MRLLQDANTGWNERGIGRGRQAICAALLSLAALSTCGCTGVYEYFQKGCKVGPNYQTPAAPVACDWIDARDASVRRSEAEVCQWWRVFNDPHLNELVCTAYRQNLTLRQAGFRILQARSRLAIDVGNLFPQNQNMFGDYNRIARSRQTAGAGGAGGTGGVGAGAPRFFDQWDFGFNLNWELDFWGRFRRLVEADSALLDVSVENYDAVLITLMGDVATNYVQMRTFEQRIKYAQDNVKIQKDTLTIVQARFEASTISELDLDQARTTVAATEAAISQLQIGLRQSILQLCTLMGIPPEDLLARLGSSAIPTAPPEVVLGIPADLLRRRPDVRAAERQLAAQSALIGVAQSELYPHIFINGTLAWSAQDLNDLFTPEALNGNVGPSFQWNILNYGRIQNAVYLQDARFLELLANYQNSALAANQDVENGLVTFLRSKERTNFQQTAVNEAVKAVNVAVNQYRAGVTDFTTVTQVQQVQVQQQDQLAQAQGDIGIGLIGVYRALGGGWQIRLTGCNEKLPPPGLPNGSPRTAPENLPAAPTIFPAPTMPIGTPSQSDRPPITAG